MISKTPDVLLGVTSLEIGKILAKLKHGIELPVYNNLVKVLVSNTELVVYRIIKSPKSVNSLEVLVGSNKGKFVLNGTDVEAMLLEVTEGDTVAPTFKEYTSMKVVEVLPEKGELKVAYLLTVDYNGKKADTVWVYDGRRYVQLSDTPIEEDPNDASTIPDTEVKEDVTGSVGSPDAVETKVWNKAVKEKTVLQAESLVTVVNSTLTNGIINVSTKGIGA